MAYSWNFAQWNFALYCIYSLLAWPIVYYHYTVAVDDWANLKFSDGALLMLVTKQLKSVEKVNHYIIETNTL